MLPLSQKEFELFGRLIKKHVGISFSSAKKIILQRKLASRLNYLGLSSYYEYFLYLRNNKNSKRELRQLINTITVGQTSFFRHHEQFELLANVILPQIAIQNRATRKLRIWSAGCASGEEVYSIAMLVNEMFLRNRTWDIKILASDIDTDALKLAYKGLYPLECIQQVPSEYLKKHFIKGTGKNLGLYKVKDALKKNILFRRLNIMDRTSHFNNPVDIVFCRNVMIYFDAMTKKKLIDNFYRLLAQKGFLCLGLSESLIGVDDRFVLIRNAIYKIE